tara:strand:- start:497 stop:1000 length:504 start_codon:yes stop_codon:yes gene_type:complete
MAKTVPMEWLIATQGVHGLEEREFDAIRDFTLLWGLFEGRAMGTRGTQNEVVAAVGRMALPDPLPDAFAAALAFWRLRYWESGGPNVSFDALHFAANHHLTHTLTVLGSGSNDPAAVTTALLQIAMRLRNNLFHGVKWQYRLHDQLPNFRHANGVLMAAIGFSPSAL